MCTEYLYFSFSEMTEVNMETSLHHRFLKVAFSDCPIPVKQIRK